MPPLLEAAARPFSSSTLALTPAYHSVEVFEPMVSVLSRSQPQKTTALLPFYVGLSHEPRRPVKDVATESGTGHKDGCESGYPLWLCQPCLACVIHCCLDKANWMLTLPPDTSESKVLPFPFLSSSSSSCAGTHGHHCSAPGITCSPNI